MFPRWTTVNINTKFTSNLVVQIIQLIGSPQLIYTQFYFYFDCTDYRGKESSHQNWFCTKDFLLYYSERDNFTNASQGSLI